MTHSTLLSPVDAASGSNGFRSPSFTIYSKGYDWGPANHKILMDMGQKVTGEVTSATFAVVGQKAAFGDVPTNIPVVDAHICHADGTPAKEGEYISLELYVHPSNLLCYPYTFQLSTFLNVKDQVQYTITLNDSLADASLAGFLLKSDASTKTVFEGIEGFVEKDFSYNDTAYGEIHLKYALYTPHPAKNRPLIILFHGAGEGGADTSIALLGNKVVSLAMPQIQSYFDGAYILVPQTPDMWMNDGSGAYTKDGTSKYTNAILSMIKEVLASHPDMDPQRVYVGGGSNGGFMTLRMLLSEPGLFAAAFPICEAFASSWISDAQLDILKNIPIWFVHATTDPVVEYTAHTGEVYRRLKEAGHPDLHLTAYETITDQTGQFKTEENAPYMYNGHWSWIPVYNDEVKENGISLFSWLSSHHR